MIHGRVLAGTHPPPPPWLSVAYGRVPLRYPREVPERDRRPRMGPPPGASDMQPWCAGGGGRTSSPAPRHVSSPSPLGHRYPPRPPKAPREEGVDFLFGVSPVRAALRSNRRKLLTLYVQGRPRAERGRAGAYEFVVNTHYQNPNTGKQ